MPINWGELLAALGVLAAVSGFIQWLVAAVVVDPRVSRYRDALHDEITELRESNRKSVEELKTWIAAQFVSKDQLQAHTQVEDERVESIHREIAHLNRKDAGPR